MPNIGVTYLDEGVAFSKKKTVHIKSSSSVSPSFLDVGYGLERFFLFIVSFTPFKTNNSLQHSKERYNPFNPRGDEEEAVRCFEDILKADNGNEEMWAVSTHADLSAGRRVSRESATQ